MFKVVIQTADPQPEIKTPILSTLNLRQSIRESSSPTLKQKSSIINGFMHLLRNVQCDTKQQISKLKSRAILVLNFEQGSKVEKILLEREMEIQYFCKIKQELKISEEVVVSAVHAVVLFKTLVIAEEIVNFIKNVTYELGTFYIDHVHIIEVEEVAVLDFCKANIIQENKNNQKWVQIPHCQKCLEMLQPSVTGIDIKQISDFNKQQNLFKQKCKVCWIRSRQESQCSSCSQIDDNWVCMVCGVVGCGRYKNADAFKHYSMSKHILSLDLKTNRIWNYMLDCFCHKIICKQDSMMEQIQEKFQSDIDDENIQLQFWKYCNVVSEQLDKQRNFYNKIKQEQIERYLAQEKVVDEKINEMMKIKQEKKENLKKKIKRNKKILKRNAELEQSCKQQRQLSKLLEESATAKCGNEKQIQSQAILRKRQELRKLEQQIQKILSSLSQI